MLGGGGPPSGRGYPSQMNEACVVSWNVATLGSAGTRLLRIARGLDAKVAICSYRSGLYDDLLDGWQRTDIKGKSYAGPRSKSRKLPDRVLSVYTNYEPPSK